MSDGNTYTSPDTASWRSVLDENDRRAKSACIRCRTRKTKCTGEYPCKKCIAANATCEYQRKRKRVNIYDTEVEAYIQRIKELEEKVKSLENSAKRSETVPRRALSVSPHPQGRPRQPVPPSTMTSAATGAAAANAAPVSASASAPTQAPTASGQAPAASAANANNDFVDLSLYLGSGSCELICWNLKQFIVNKANPPSSSASKDIFISPEFNSFIEESVYDYLLSETTAPSLAPIESLTIEKAEALLGNVVQFLTSSYLTLDINSFKRRLPNYFHENGLFKVEKLRGYQESRYRNGSGSSGSGSLPDTNDSDYFFLIKIIMICTLGEIYSLECSLGNASINMPPFTLNSTPGLHYFKVVIHYLPSIFSTFSLSKRELESNLDIIESLGLMAMYLRCLDKKNLAVMFTINALQMCMSLNLHKSSKTLQEAKIFWSTFCLNRFLCSRIGKSLLLRDEEITTPMPNVLAEKTVTTNEPTTIPEEFAKSNVIVYYINLAKLAESITNDIYCFKRSIIANENWNKEYLNSILTNVHNLVDWVDQLPDFLKLKIPLKAGRLNNRLVYTLHLNYLHHIHLASIPILLNVAKSRLSTINTNTTGPDTKPEPFYLDVLPRNIRTIITICIQSSQLTVNLFIALYKENLTRVFGFTDLDFLTSSSLVFMICLILNVPNLQDNYSFEEYLQASVNLIGEMKNKGNLVARGKLNQILDLISTLKETRGSTFDFIFEHIKSYFYEQYNQPTIMNLINTPSAENSYSISKSPSQGPPKLNPSRLSSSHISPVGHPPPHQVQSEPHFPPHATQSRSHSNPNSQGHTPSHAANHPQIPHTAPPPGIPHIPAAASAHHLPHPGVNRGHHGVANPISNQVINGFDIAKDLVDYSYLTEPQYNDFPFVTDEDMSFMNSIIQDFQY